jgi:glutamate-1-semialdehyde 2,1-aminomutase
MATMNGFLRHTLTAEYAAAVESAGETWDERRVALNERLVSAGLPIRFRNLASIWVLVYLVPSRYNWMLQYYLRAEGLSLAWVGTARFIFSHNYTAADFETVADRIVRAAERMQADGWWTVPEELTNGEIGRRVTKEMLLSMIGAGRRRRRSAGDPEGGELGYG